MLNLYFTKCFNRVTAPLEQVHRDSPPTDDFLQICIVMNFRCDLLYGLDVSKSSGPDGISARMLKYTAASIAPSICKLFNLSMRVGRLPEMWKLLLVVWIPKASNSHHINNHQSISLLCILSSDGKAYLLTYNFTPRGILSTL